MEEAKYIQTTAGFRFAHLACAGSPRFYSANYANPSDSELELPHALFLVEPTDAFGGARSSRRTSWVRARGDSWKWRKRRFSRIHHAEQSTNAVQSTAQPSLSLGNNGSWLASGVHVWCSAILPCR